MVKRWTLNPEMSVRPRQGKHKKEKMKIQFDSDHDNATNSQVFIAITGTPDIIKRELEKILKDIKESRKPIQGIRCSIEGTSEIITPIYNGKKY